MAALFLFNVGFAEREIAQRVKSAIGLDLTIKGGAHVTLMPLSIRLDDVTVTKPGSDPIMTAQSLSVPLTVRGLLSRHLAPREAFLEAPAFRFVVNDEGRPNWAMGGDALDQSLSQNAVAGNALSLSFANGVLDYVSRGTSFGAQGLRGHAVLSTQGALKLDMSLLLKRRPAKLALEAASLARIMEDGTPADATLTAGSLGASFSGRLRARDQIEFAGTADIASRDVGADASWAGVVMTATPRGASLTGSFEGIGGSLNFPAAMIVADGAAFKGDVSFNADAPKLRARLSGDRVDLDPYLSLAMKGSPPTLPDLDIAVAARDVTWSGISLGSMTVEARRENGATSLAIPDAKFFGGAGFARFRFGERRIDAEFDLKQADLSQLSREPKLQGRADVSAAFSAEGTSLDSLWSSLAGQATVLGGMGSLDGAGSFKDFSASFNLRDGVADTKDASLTLDGRKMDGNGQIDLLRQALDLELSSGGKRLTLKGPLSGIVRGD